MSHNAVEEDDDINEEQSNHLYPLLTHVYSHPSDIGVRKPDLGELRSGGAD